MLYRIVGVDVATQQHVESHCDVPDIEAAGRFATETGILVERIETNDGSVVWKSEPPRATRSVATRDPANAIMLQRAKNPQANSVGCLVGVACLMVLLCSGVFTSRPSRPFSEVADSLSRSN